jgi:hypothetical protein
VFPQERTHIGSSTCQSNHGDTLLVERVCTFSEFISESDNTASFSEQEAKITATAIDNKILIDFILFI